MKPPCAKAPLRQISLPEKSMIFASSGSLARAGLGGAQMQHKITAAVEQAAAQTNRQ